MLAVGPAVKGITGGGGGIEILLVGGGGIPAKPCIGSMPDIGGIGNPTGGWDTVNGDISKK